MWFLLLTLYIHVCTTVVVWWKCLMFSYKACLSLLCLRSLYSSSILNFPHPLAPGTIFKKTNWNSGPLNLGYPLKIRLYHYIEYTVYTESFKTPRPKVVSRNSVKCWSFLSWLYVVFIQHNAVCCMYHYRIFDASRSGRKYINYNAEIKFKKTDSIIL